MLKPKVGDMVTLKPMPVTQVGESSFVLHYGSVSYAFDAIASIEPRPLQVEDQIEYEFCGEVIRGKILSIYGGKAWILCYDTYRTISIDLLTRVEDKP